MSGSRPEHRPERTGGSLIVGRILCSVGVVFAVTGAFFVEVGTDVVGMVLGATGYYLGARTFGIATIVLSTITFVVGLLAGQDVIPGSYDEVVNGLTRTFEK
jgi:hypothetical protein